MSDDFEMTSEDISEILKSTPPSSMVEEGAPPNGWLPEDFPQITVAPIPYTSNSNIRTDPTISILPNEWMYVEVGNVRIAFPDEEEWEKFVNMGNRMWITHKQEQEIGQQNAYAEELS